MLEGETTQYHFKPSKLEGLGDTAAIIDNMYISYIILTNIDGLMHPNILRNIVNNSQDMEATSVCIDRWMDKDDVVYPHTVE